MGALWLGVVASARVTSICRCPHARGGNTVITVLGAGWGGQRLPVLLSLSFSPRPGLCFLLLIARCKLCEKPACFTWACVSWGWPEPGFLWIWRCSSQVPYTHGKTSPQKLHLQSRLSQVVRWHPEELGQEGGSQVVAVLFTQSPQNK